MRLFVAVPLPCEVEKGLGELIETSRQQIDSARWVRSENLHLTLVFLGDVAEDEVVAKVVAVLEGVAAGFSPFAVETDELGSFPERGRVRVLWIGLKGEARSRLLELRARTFDELTKVVPLKAGERDRAFHPHVTLARLSPPRPRRVYRRWRERAQCSRAVVPVREMRLLSSRLAPDGARYRTLRSFPLGGAA